MLALSPTHIYHHVACNGDHLINPYHNHRHCLDVYNWCKKIYGDVLPPREVCLASLFHDFDHSGGTCPDALNVKWSIEALIRYCGDNKISSALAKQAIDLIAVTEFISTTDGWVRAPKTFEQCAIRDADLMVVYQVDAAYAMLSLYQEVRGSYPQLTVQGFWESQSAFLLNAPMYTKYGKGIKNARLQRTLQELTPLILGDADGHT